MLMHLFPSWLLATQRARCVSTSRAQPPLPETLEGRRMLAASPAPQANPVTLPDNPAGTIFIDVGNPSPLVDVAGTTTWAPDAGFSGGKLVRRKLAVEGTEDDALFATRRQGDFTYMVPVPDGQYALSLLFVDTAR